MNNAVEFFPKSTGMYDTVLVKTIRLLLNFCLNALMVLIVFVCLLYSFQTGKFGVYELHIILCVIGYQVLMSQGILVISKYNYWSIYLPRRHKISLHVLLQSCSIIVITIGTAVMSYHEKVNFNTTHGILALCALIMSIMSSLDGIILMYGNNINPCLSALWVKSGHYIFGLGGLLCSSASLCYGYKKGPFRKWTNNDDYVVVLIVFTSVFTVFVLVEFFISVGRKLRSFVQAENSQEKFNQYERTYIKDESVILSHEPKDNKFDIVTYIPILYFLSCLRDAFPYNMTTPFEVNLVGDNTNNRIGNYASPAYVTLMSVATTLTNMCLGAVVMCLIFFLNSFSASASMKQHVYLCGIGYLILMAQAVHALNPHSGWARLVKYQDRRVIHWMLQIVGSILVIVGSIIRMMAVSNNFTTTHGILGLIAFISTVLSMICGLVSAYATKLKLSPFYVKIAHSCIGSLTLSAAFISLCFGLKDTARSVMGKNNADLAISLTVLGLIGTLLSPCLDVIKKVVNRVREN